MSAQNKISTNGTLPKWQRERCHWFNKIFTNVERRMSNGWRLHESLVWFAWYYRTHRRFYRCEPSRRFRCAEGTLRQNYYLWRDGGRTPEVLVIHYRPSRLKLPLAEVTAFVDAALVSGAVSYIAVPRPDSSATVGAYYHALSAPLKKQLGTLFALRRAAIRTEQNIRRAIPPA